jgi:acyl-CoA reductase-like NAD-dependent aldehyde dehydrogenase
LTVRLDAGVIWIDHYNITPVAMPFGGRRLSGLGRENGKAAIRPLHGIEERPRRIESLND